MRLMLLLSSTFNTVHLTRISEISHDEYSWLKRDLKNEVACSEAYN